MRLPPPLIGNARFSIAHYQGPTKGSARHNYMSDDQARAFLDSARQLIPCPVARLGHSAELGLKVPSREFVDEKCFHFETTSDIRVA